MSFVVQLFSDILDCFETKNSFFDMYWTLQRRMKEVHPEASELFLMDKIGLNER